MSVHEVQIALSFLYSTLAGDATLASLTPGGIWRGKAPPLDDNGNTLPTPYVVLGMQSGGNDTLTANAVRVMSKPLYQVHATGQADATQAVANAASEIDTLLKRTSGAVTGGLTLVCYRESPLEIDEDVNGEMWISIGGLYRLLLQQTSL